MKRETRKEKAARLYACLLRLYPREHRDAFGSHMLQTFKDHYTDVVESGYQSERWFWFGVVSDGVRSILREYITSVKEKTTMNNAWVKPGLFFGVLLGMFHLGYNLINNLAPANPTINSLLNMALPFALITLTGGAGSLAARTTGQMKMGTYAGLCAGLLSIIIGIAALFLITFSCMDIVRQNAFLLDDFRRSGMTSMDAFILDDALGAAFFGLCLSLITGGLFGTVGGYLGKRRRRRNNDE